MATVAAVPPAGLKKARRSRSGWCDGMTSRFEPAEMFASIAQVLELAKETIDVSPC